MVAFGHEGYFSQKALPVDQTALLVKRLIEYAASGRPDHAGPIRVGARAQPDIKALADAGCTVVEISGIEYAKHLDSYDVVVVGAGDLEPAWRMLL